MSSNPRKRTAETQEEAWVADEDRFVLQQAKKKAALRVQAGRARPIDLLAVALRTIDPSRNGLDDDEDDDQALVATPEAIFDGLSGGQLKDLEKEVDTYLALERNRSNQQYWQTMKTVCRDRQREEGDTGRRVASVAQDLDRILGPKTLPQLEALEKQVKQKLRGDEAMDVDYWESLLKRLSVHKARAELRRVSQQVIDARMKGVKAEQAEAAAAFANQVAARLGAPAGTQGGTFDASALDPESSLKISAADKALPAVDVAEFNDHVRRERARITKKGHVPEQSSAANHAKPSAQGSTSSTGNAAYDREVARGFGEGEEIFTGEDDGVQISRPAWADKYIPRKPKYFNRVLLGFEWNKYNQTHYDQDNPPPKVVQGYKFNIFYPDLVDQTKAPTYRIEREDGRRRGQTLAPAGEEDTCVIRFTAGPPYEELAFRIVDREWDYSAKRERGFKSSFDKGILQLHFQFKKIYYRK